MTVAAGLHHVELVMGMAVSIDVRDEIDPRAIGEVVAWLHHVDRTFSTYIDDSPISRLGRGEIDLADVGEEIRGVLRTCEWLREESDGAFDAFAVPAPNGTTFDPSGLVKGWSIEQAARILETHGAQNLCINAGGDIALRGRPEPGASWRVGLRHPEHSDALALVLEAAGTAAVATSATYERGAHIFDPRVGHPTTELASVTIVGTDLTLADGYATTVFVMGLDGLAWLEGRGYDGLAVTHDGRVLATDGFARWRVS
jgi:thiamine biosynthesis lipoprotein